MLLKAFMVGLFSLWGQGGGGELIMGRDFAFQ